MEEEEDQILARLVLLCALFTTACGVDQLVSLGRPCSPSDPCGPEAVCDPASKTCVRVHNAGTDAGGDARIIPSHLDGGASPDGPPTDGPPMPPDGRAPLPDGPVQQPDAPLPDGPVQQPDAPPPLDKDGDTIPDSTDNCPTTANKDQKDLDKDGAGDACDPDIDGDTIPNPIDPNPSVADSVLYFGFPGASSSDFDLAGGSWQPSGNSLCQTAQTAETQARLKPSLLPATDYLVETRFTVSAVASTALYWPDAGLAFRTTTSKPYEHTYHCVVNLKEDRLVITADFGGNWSQLTQSPSGSVPSWSSGPYTMRATAKGSQLTCELLPSGPKITTFNALINNGSVGFTAFRATVCFDYLLVLPAP